jgi:hypothetical protein
MLNITAAVLVAGLLVSGPAQAGCAWVLWSEMSFTWTAKEPTIIIHETFETKARCEQFALKLAKDIKAHRKGVRGDGLMLWWPSSASPDGQGEVEQRFQCLPDTIDPRGPKEAKR